MQKLNHQPLRKLIAALFAGVVLTTHPESVISYAQAEASVPAKKIYHIPAGSLSSALSQFAADSGILLSADAVLASGKTSQGLQGSYSVDDGLAALLAGSGLVATKNATGYIVHKKAANEAHAEPETLPEVIVHSTPHEDKQSAKELYIKNQSSSAIKSDVVYADTPFSVQSVSESLRRDQGVVGVREMAENISGVMSGPTSIHEDLLIRGFQIRDTYRNGVPTRRIGLTETSNVESVTVVKGPSSVLFGRGEVGGVLNVETKKPLWAPHLMVQQRAGSRDLTDTSLDGGGVIGDTLAYRVNGLYRHADSFRDGVSGERYFIAPTFNWKPTDKLDINLDLEAFKDTTPNDKGQIAVGQRVNDISRRINFSGNHTHRDFQNQLAAFTGQYQINDDWKVKATAYYEQSKEQGLEYVQAAGAGFGFPDNTVLRLPRDIEKRDIKAHYYQTEVWGKFNTGSVKHDIVIGADKNNSSGTFHFNDGDVGLGQLEVVDINQPIPNPLLTTGDDRTRLRNDAEWAGYYIQDHIHLNEKLSLLLGLRHDNAKTSTFNKINQSASQTQDSQDSPRIGVTFKLTPEWRIFGQYTESLGLSNAGVSASGRAFNAESGRQTEVGLKYENLARTMLATIATYDLTKSNILVPDIANSGFSTQSGKAGSQGIELDFSGQLTSHLNLLLACATTSTKVIESTNPGEAGNQLYGVPHNVGRVFFRYDVEAGGRRGWSFGGGAYAVSSQQGDLANSFEIAGYTRWDAFAAYRLPTTRGHYTFQLNAQNLTDREYYIASGSRDSVGVGEPRKIIGSLRIDF